MADPQRRTHEPPLSDGIEGAATVVCAGSVQRSSGTCPLGGVRYSETSGCDRQGCTSPGQWHRGAGPVSDHAASAGARNPYTGAHTSRTTITWMTIDSPIYSCPTYVSEIHCTIARVCHVKAKSHWAAPAPCVGRFPGMGTVVCSDAVRRYVCPDGHTTNARRRARVCGGGGREGW
jgi:hypothetical protein